MKGKLYAYVHDAGRRMLVQLDAPFPVDRFDLNEWRLIDIAVEAKDEATVDALRRDGFVELPM